MNGEFSLDWYFPKNICLSNEIQFCLAVSKNSLYQLLLAIDRILYHTRTTTRDFCDKTRNGTV